jgi:hypothetical protein
MLEWFSREIARICHALDCCVFLNEEKRAQLRVELSDLLKMREGYRDHQARLAIEARSMLKDPG